MSYYDDASIMFIGGAATGVDGKAGTAKPINGGSPLYVTRGSNLTATRVDSNGLIEKGRENTQLYTNNLSNLNSNQYGKNELLISTAQADPFGNNDAVLVTPTTTNSYHRWYKLNATSVGVQTISLYAKPNGYTNIYAFCNESNQNVTYSLVGSGSVITASANTIDSKIEQLSGGWYRISHTINCSSTNWWGIYIGTSTAAYVGDGTSGVYFYGLQVEIGLVATEYIESGATTGKAGLLENEPRFNYPIGGSVPHLLLEPQRTNIIGYSEYFDDWQKSEVSLDFGYLAPDGTYSAYKVSALSMSAASLYRSAVELDNTYTRSIWAKTRSGTGVVSLLSYKNNTNNVFTITDEWQRFDVSDVAEATGLGNFYAVDFRAATTTLSEVIIWGAQAEQGSYPTSYIPNHTAGSVTRGSESYQNSDIDAVTNMSTDECTVLLDVELPQGREGSPRFLTFWDIAGGSTTVWGFKGVYEPAPIIQLHAQGTITTSSTHSLSVGRHKIAVRWLSGTATVYIDGAEVSALSTTDSAAPTSFDKVTGDGSGYRHFVHELIVFESGWDNVDLEILTGVTGYQSFAAMAATLNYTVYE